MTIVQSSQAMPPSRMSVRQPCLTPRLSRVLMMSIVIGAVGMSLSRLDGAETSTAAMSAGGDLTRLLRFMALIKAVMAAAAFAAVLWRLGSEVSLGRFAAYGAACATMATGPGLIWGMVHVGLGALFLHAGLFAVIVLLWRDPAIPVRLEAALLTRRG